MDLGIGNDQLTLQGLQTTGMVLAMLGAGNDVLKVSRCELGTALFVGGLGYDRFERDDPSYRSLWFERIVDLPLQAAIVQAFSLTMSSGAGYAFGRLVLRTTDGYTTWQFSPYSGPTPTGMHIHRWGQSPDVPLLDLGVPVVKFGKITGSAVVNQGTATEIVNALGQGFYMDIHYQGGSMASNLAPVS
jgi:hypothetical protein